MNDSAACGHHSGRKWPLGKEPRECPAITDMSRERRTVEVICREAYNMGIKYLTVYAVLHGELEALAG